VDFALSPSGELTFANAAEQAGAAPSANSYRVQWARFDNATGEATDLGGEMTVTDRRAQAPGTLASPDGRPEFVRVRVAAIHPAHSSWATPVTVYFRRSQSGWTLVGLERLPK
jgi:hypothetical protein